MNTNSLADKVTNMTTDATNTVVKEYANELNTEYNTQLDIINHAKKNHEYIADPSHICSTRTYGHWP